MPRPASSPRSCPPMSRTLVALTTVAAGVLLTGCSATPGQDTTSSRSAADPHDRLVSSLWADRTAHVGDNSKVIALVGDTGLDDLGPRAISLQTVSTPYGLTVRYPGPVKAGGPIDLTPQATLLLGTVGNLDRVTVEANGSTFTLTAAAASRTLGHDVKRLGTDRDALARYVASLDD